MRRWAFVIVAACGCGGPAVAPATVANVAAPVSPGQLELADMAVRNGTPLAVLITESGEVTWTPMGAAQQALRVAIDGTVRDGLSQRLLATLGPNGDVLDVHGGRVGAVGLDGSSVTICDEDGAIHTLDVEGDVILAPGGQASGIRLDGAHTVGQRRLALLVVVAMMLVERHIEREWPAGYD